ncbi:MULTISPECIES: sodium/substrate symporter small subunit [Rubrivivax]|uniref:DUF4212 domain-containing protein n=1 Tax=Rubrivivax benzoatilyticus TaxID=316997 RepID=A0ABX0HXV6_9BURK|nr:MULTISPECIES: sodium/substrate symporter small subunit [Rubrivivax]MCD0423367.1 DUF4212 domain-containing protein [Rubrivivax sp. JA1024]EGJ12125.1 hypothetical protein RBXJA2T_17424 [Rubrivivax benzoatilyticus JA2 = ATCC BAA-35]MCC9595179.1 DUF4212 domain-containing protein [Rubrivivax sp. JA1055]MCC9648029.1 DUF4212 domain-containing protein [Rubrivivax sp. JA1029]NHK99824.1 DUF4212 domain-containing protein [Rubrivivax benzoatilyticus]
MSPELERRQAERRRRDWRRNRRLTGWLLLAWFVVTFVVAFFARELDFGFFGAPFGFWVAAQGAPIVYLVIVWVYAIVMDRRDDQRGDPGDD